MTSLRILTAAALAAMTMGAAAQAQPQTSADVLDRLHEALHLSANQEAAWAAFQAASGPDSQQQARERSAQMMMPNLHAPQRVDLSIAVMRADMRTMERRGAALKTFYATLTPAQQATFDRETLPPSQPQDRQ